MPTLRSEIERKCAERGTKGSSYNPLGRRIIPGNYCKVALKYAEVTELADVPVLEAGAIGVWVQVPSSAPVKK